MDSGGLSMRMNTTGDKPAWSVLRSYYLNDTLSCAYPFPQQCDAACVVDAQHQLLHGDSRYGSPGPRRGGDASLERSHGGSYREQPGATQRPLPNGHRG